MTSDTVEATVICAMADVGNIVDELRGEYVEHGLGQVGEIDEALQALRSNPADTDALREIHRQVHSIKGTAYSFGMPEISLFAAAWEKDIHAAEDGDIAPRLPGWRRLLDILAHLFGFARGGEPATASRGTEWTNALVWTPFAANRKRLASLAQSRGASVGVARTDREAVAMLARGGIDTILSDTVTDAELTIEQRARLIGAAAAGTAACWIVEPGADGGGEAEDRLAVALRYGARPAG